MLGSRLGRHAGASGTTGTRAPRESWGLALVGSLRAWTAVTTHLRPREPAVPWCAEPQFPELARVWCSREFGAEEAA